MSNHVTETKARTFVGTTFEATSQMPSDQFYEQADAAEMESTKAAASEAANGTEPMIFRVGAAGERDQVDRGIKKIGGYRDNLIVGIKDGEIDTDALAQNAYASEILGDLLISSGEQTRTLSDFQVATHQVKFDMVRFESQLSLIQKENPTLTGNLIDAWGGQKELLTNAKKVSTEGGGATHWSAMQTDHSELEHWVSEAAATQMLATSEQYKVSSAIERIEAGIPTSEKKSVEGSEVLGITAAIKKVTGDVIDIAAKFAHADMAAAPAKALAEIDIDFMFSKQLNALEAKTGETARQQKHGAERSQVADLRACLSAWGAALKRSRAARDHIQALKANMRDSARQFAGAAENKGEFAVGMISSLYAEADALVQQIQLAIGMGEAELKASEPANQDADRINGLGVAFDMVGHGVRFYEPIKTYTGGQLTYSAKVRSLEIGLAGQGGTEGTRGINPVVNAALLELKQLKPVVSTSRDRLGAALGFGRTTSGRDQ